MSNSFTSHENDMFAVLRGNDLRQLLLDVENFLLTYRNSLGLDRKISFGVELEYENLVKKNTDEFVEKNLRGWNSKCDGTVTTGGEVTSPILHDVLQSWNELKLMCDFLRKSGANTLEKAGGHIHVGANALGNKKKDWLCFLKLYTVYEHVLFRFFYGEKLNGRSNISSYAPPISYLTLTTLNSLKASRALYVSDSVLGDLLLSRNTINFCNVNFGMLNQVDGYKNTIEFRCPNATVNEVIEQNNVNVCTKLLVASRKENIDTELLDYKIKHEFKRYNDNKYLYDEICLKDALEFVDLIFDNNLDKAYFLRQYFKNFEDNLDLGEITKAKVFYKVER